MIPADSNKVAAGVGAPSTMPTDITRKISGRSRSSEPSTVSLVLLAFEESSDLKLASSGKEAKRLLTRSVTARD